MKRDYSDPQYKTWRHAIYSRDKFCCRWPGCSKKKRLNAHHILRWSDFPGLRYHISNGITLCYSHHKSIQGNEDAYSGIFAKIISSLK